jgi:hypothetical protein
MLYLFGLLVYDCHELRVTHQERLAIVAAHGAFLRRVREGGREATGEPLGGSREAIVVRRSDGSATDGPFLETKEQLGGFYAIDCRDRDEAVALAREIPTSPGLVVEIRPIPA